MLTVLIALVVIVGIPLLVILPILKKADDNTIIYTPEQVSERFKRGFFLSFWGLDVMYGVVPLIVVSAIFIKNIGLAAGISVGAFFLGVILFFIGRMQVGLTSRYLNFCNRELTPMEQLTLQKLLRMEEAAGYANLVSQITRISPGSKDDVLAAVSASGVIKTYYKVGKLYTGKNLLKNHWTMLVVLILIVIIVLAGIL